MFRRADLAGRVDHRGGQAKADANHVPEGVSAAQQQALDGGGGSFQDRGGVAFLAGDGTFGGLGDDGVGQVRDGDAQVTAADVDADDQASGSVQLDDRGWPAAGRAGRGRTTRFDHQARCGKFADHCRDGGAGQPGGVDQFRPASTDQALATSARCGLGFRSTG
ncbi:hypothetical protein [Fodinicola feengrottensis]|uniref:hypothetical protein n=1 Tax=Fodinicola feengrottensis TaxID=435914 RepID=UPI00244297B3|nr:hypothetical protein [Fodinicola feengrottensis]